MIRLSKHVIFAFVLHTFLFTPTNVNAQQASPNIEDAQEAISNAQTADSLKAAYQRLSPQLNYMSEAHIDTHLLYLDRLAKLSSQKAAERQFDDLLDNIEDVAGDDSFSYLYAFTHQLPLAGTFKYNKLKASIKRRWRAVERFAKNVEGKDELIQLSLLSQRAESADVFSTGTAKMASVAKIINSKTDALFEAGTQERLTLKRYSAKLYFKSKREKLGLSILQDIASELDSSNLERDFEISIRKSLILSFERNEMPELANQQLLAIAEFERLENVNKAPEFLVRVDPRYPMDAVKAGQNGSVSLSFDINELGETVNIKVLEVNGYRSFGDAAKNAVELWRYIPKIQNGEFVFSENHETELSFFLDQ